MLTTFIVFPGAAPVRWTVSRLRFLLSSPSILHPSRGLPPQTAEALAIFSSVRRKSIAYKAPGALARWSDRPRIP